MLSISPSIIPQRRLSLSVFFVLYYSCPFTISSCSLLSAFTIFPWTVSASVSLQPPRIQILNRRTIYPHVFNFLTPYFHTTASLVTAKKEQSLNIFHMSFLTYTIVYPAAVATGISVINIFLCIRLQLLIYRCKLCIR